MRDALSEAVARTTFILEDASAVSAPKRAPFHCPNAEALVRSTSGETITVYRKASIAAARVCEDRELRINPG